MGFRNGAFAKVWEVKPNRSGKSTAVRLTVSKKLKDGGYEEDFSGWVTFIVAANEKAKKLRNGDRIKLGDVDVSSTYNRDTKEKSYSFKAFSFDIDGGNKAALGGSGIESETPDDFPV